MMLNTQPLIKQFNTHIARTNLIEKGDRIVVAFSGGVDSVALLLLLHEISATYDLSLFPVYVHHHIRNDADCDITICQTVCNYCKLELIVEHIDIPSIVKAEKCSEEEAGRIARYERLQSIAGKIDATTIAVAHHMDDQSETVLHRLVRGTGLLGLGGMKSRNKNIIRPLLFIEKAALKSFVEAHGLPYVEDYTNNNTDYTRNHIRHELVPYLKKNYNPNIAASLYKLSLILQEEEDYIEEQSKTAFDQVVTVGTNNGSIDVSFGISQFSSLHMAIQKRLVFLCVSKVKGNQQNIEYNHIMRVIGLLQLNSGKQVDVVEGIIAFKEFERIHIIHKQQLSKTSSGFAQTLDMKTDKGYIQSAKIAYATYYYSIKNYKDSFKISQNAYTKSFDCDKIETTLTLRTRKPGDFINIDHEGHTKTLKKFFVDEKIPLSIRDSIPLLAMDNRILWVVGYRINPIFEVKPDSKKIFVLELTKEEVNGNN